MVDEICRIKDDVLMHMSDKVDERNLERLDLSELADIVKDLAEAEEKCWKAEYYRSVSEAMDGGQSGYNSTMTPGGAGGNVTAGTSGYDDGRSGWANQYGSGRNRYSRRRGYSNHDHSQAMDSIRNAMRNAEPEERKRLESELQSLLGGGMR